MNQFRKALICVAAFISGAATMEIAREYARPHRNNRRKYENNNFINHIVIDANCITNVRFIVCDDVEKQRISAIIVAGAILKLLSKYASLHIYVLNNQQADDMQRLIADKKWNDRICSIHTPDTEKQENALYAGSYNPRKYIWFYKLYPSRKNWAFISFALWVHDSTIFKYN
jgi:hypothetical protein